MAKVMYGLTYDPMKALKLHYFKLGLFTGLVVISTIAALVFILAIYSKHLPT